jgi:hypothetical protein
VGVLNIRCAIVKTVKWKMEIHFKWPITVILDNVL